MSTQALALWKLWQDLGSQESCSGLLSNAGNCVGTFSTGLYIHILWIYGLVLTSVHSFVQAVLVYAFLLTLESLTLCSATLCMTPLCWINLCWWNLCWSSLHSADQPLMKASEAAPLDVTPLDVTPLMDHLWSSTWTHPHISQRLFTLVNFCYQHQSTSKLYNLQSRLLVIPKSNKIFYLF